MKKIIITSFTFIMTIFIFSLMTISISAEEHKVKKGDTLWDIANTHHTTVQKLKDINHLDDTVIYPGQTLNTEENKSNNIKNHIVKKGDTLSELAEEFGTSIKDIKDQNNLSSDLIIIGEVLKINLSEKKNTDHLKQNERVMMKNRTKNDSTEQASEKLNKSTKTSVEKQSESPSGKTISVSATAYTAYCDGCSGITATGVNLIKNPNQKVIAVDPNVIPLGTKVYVEGYGYATAEDTGGAIIGNRIDVYFPSKNQALNWGVQSVDVTIVE